MMSVVTLAMHICHVHHVDFPVWCRSNNNILLLVPPMAIVLVLVAAPQQSLTICASNGQSLGPGRPQAFHLTSLLACAPAGFCLAVSSSQAEWAFIINLHL